MLTGFPRTRWPRLRFSESYAVRISVKISRICEFRVIMGIMTGLLGCCSSSTLGSRANDYVKTLATLGFWLHHSPCSLGCWTNNTLAARSLSPKYSFPCENIKPFTITDYWWVMASVIILAKRNTVRIGTCIALDRYILSFTNIMLFIMKPSVNMDSCTIILRFL